MLELTKVTSKGQVVIPSEIRKELDLKEGVRLVVSVAGDIVLMKKVEIADPKEEFKELTKLGKELAKKEGIKSEEDVVARILNERGIKSN